MARNSGTSADNRRRVVVYYRGPHIIVTSRYIENTTGRYAVHAIGSVRRVHEAGHPARTVALVCGAVELAIAAPLALAYGSAVLLCAGLVMACGVAAAHLADDRRNPRQMSLRAVHDGSVVTLFRSRRQREFEQVRRAVIRAVEANERPHP